MASREDLHTLIDELPDRVIAEVIDFAEFVAEKVRRQRVEAAQAKLDALPEDDEEVSEETWARIQASESETERISFDTIKAELGL